jgi:hypothetical protein
MCDVRKEKCDVYPYPFTSEGKSVVLAIRTRWQTSPWTSPHIYVKKTNKNAAHGKASERKEKSRKKSTSKIIHDAKVYFRNTLSWGGAKAPRGFVTPGQRNRMHLDARIMSNVI